MIHIKKYYESLVAYNYVIIYAINVHFCVTLQYILYHSRIQTAIILTVFPLLPFA